MDILRNIKLMHLFGELQNLTPEEIYFFELHDGLHYNKNGHLCDDKTQWLVYYDFEYGYFWYHHTPFYLAFKQKFNIDELQFKNGCSC